MLPDLALVLIDSGEAISDFQTLQLFSRQAVFHNAHAQRAAGRF